MEDAAGGAAVYTGVHHSLPFPSPAPAALAAYRDYSDPSTRRNWSSSGDGGMIWATPDCDSS